MNQSPARLTRAFLLSLLGACVLAAVVPVIAEANQFGRHARVLHAFGGGTSDGAEPVSGVARDAQGNLYGATRTGGAYNKGTLYKIGPDGRYRVLTAFGKHNGGGALPLDTPLILADGSLVGPASRADGQTGSVIYKLSPNGHLSMLHRFGIDDPVGYNAHGLVADGGGNLYSATQNGGPFNCGTVFRLHADGTTDFIYAFKGGADDGCGASGPVAFDAVGNLYGSTSGGEYNGGAIYRIAPDGTETILHMFGSNDESDDGAGPSGPVALDGAGNLYGATQSGTHATSLEGTVYKITPDGTETVLQRFALGAQEQPSRPVGGVIVDADGNIYGTTLTGGLGLDGVVFKISPRGRLRILHAFYAFDGVMPISLAFGGDGSLIGTTDHGGVGRYGTLFKINLP